ncbi:MAG: Crp/Fnr family transcriptional regulator [Desulfitobacterium sp.]
MDDGLKRIIQDPLIPETFHRVEQLEQVVHLARTRTYAKGTIILAQGMEFDEILYVQKGCLAVSMGADDGHQKFLFHISEGSIVLPTFLGEYHEMQIHAVKNSTISFFKVEQILDISRQDERIMLDVLQNLLTKVYYFMGQARDLNFYRPSSRVFRLLYNLCINEGQQVGDHYEINFSLTQKTIGEITGTHYVTVCKLFQLLDKQGILTKSKDKMIIYDLERLKSLINEVIEY